MRKSTRKAAPTVANAAIPQQNAKKHSQGGNKKHSHINPAVGGRPGLGVCDLDGLRDLLSDHGQFEWTTRTRLFGLLSLQDFMLRSLRKDRVALSLVCSHQYIGPIKRVLSDHTIREPLHLLCGVGLWRKVQGAVNHHVINSAVYALCPYYRDRKKSIILHCSPGQARRLNDTEMRRQKRLNRSHSWRATLKIDQRKLSFSPDTLKEVAELLDTSKEGATKRAQNAVTLGEHKEPSWSLTGTIYGTLNGIPRELKLRLLIEGERAVMCDISYAHHCFLPVLLRNRIEHCSKGGASAKYLSQCKTELKNLTQFLSEGDYYSKWCDDPFDEKQRAAVKKLATQVLNMKNEHARGVPLYRKMKSMFPCTFGILEDIKKKYHQTPSKQLQRFTADVIEASLLRVQALGVAAIPDTDSLLVPEKHREVTCRIMGEEMFKATKGVCSKVGGIRFSPGDRTFAEKPSADSGRRAFAVLPTPAKKDSLPPRSSRSEIEDLCNDKIVRAAFRIFNVDQPVEITDSQGSIFLVPLPRFGSR